ncbi:MAG: YfbK domain-containing protein [Candidatus Dadabacteria bacterium]
MKQIIYTAIVILSPLFAISQQYYIKGQVTDETGNGLQNVTIRLHSSPYIYYTGTAGAFGIISSSTSDTLTFLRDGFEREKVPIRSVDYVDVKLKKVPAKSANASSKLLSLTENLKRSDQQQWFTGEETYASMAENNFISASAFPSTALTLNSDRASYSNIRRWLNMNSIVPPDAVRMEELLNYFNFNYSEPSTDKTFTISSTYTSCPWNKSNRLLLTQINSKKLNIDTLPPTNLVLLVDVSGSMDMPNRLPVLKAGFKSLVRNLRAKDSVSIVVYGGTVGIALNNAGGDEKERIFRVIDSLQAGGSTPGESGLKLAYSLAKYHFIKDGNNRVILATDGDFNVGMKTETELENFISEKRNSGIYLTCLGIGMGNYKDSKIQALAQRGNGNFAYLDSYAEAEKVMLKEFTQNLYTVADDTYMSVDFDPDHVKEYRLIGFDNKIGALRDSTAIVEGGEIGSAFSTLVAFEITPQDKDNMIEQQPVVFSIHFKDPVSRQTYEITEAPLVKFREFSLLPKYQQFATSVIMFGSLIRNSKFVKTNWSDIQKIAKASADDNDYSEKEFLLLLEQARKIYSHRKKKQDL